MAKHVIELNGQKYDAKTGQLVSAAKTPVKKAATTAAATKHLDGFSRRPVNRAGTATKPLHSKTQKSQTLMRKVVKKPVAPAKVHHTVTAPSAVQKTAKQAPKFTTIKPGRTIRANSVSQSDLISKFGKQPATIHSKVMPVKPAPADVSPKKPVAAAAPIQKAPAATPIQKAPAAAPAITNAAAPKKKNDVFQKAIENAASHNAPKLKKSRMRNRIAKKLNVSPKLVSFTGGVMAVLLVGSVFAYQNMPEIAMKIAATRAGLNANLPAYQPSGFALAGPIKYDSGEVTINYKSNSDDRAFNVIQKNSSWNSETLLENFVETATQSYQTFQANGRTIYIYDGNKATWVDGGVWYNIDGQANLNSDQLLKIAESL